jgi:hypothetical protein
MTMMTPENTYRAVVVEVGIGKATTETRQLALLWEIQRGPFEGRRITWRGFLNTIGNAKKCAEVMRVAGYDGRKLNSMLGAEADIVVRHEEYKGKTYARVAFVNPLPRLAIKEDLAQEEQAALLGAINQLVSSVPFDPETGELLERHDGSPEADDKPFWPPSAL